MPIATRAFRVFVSSTFEDLKEERNALQREVWPKLRALCEQHGARFQAIDLRWGIRDEAALDQKTMDICLREIRRCQATQIKPNFIVLLGDRYGWLPLPSRIPASELDPRPVAGDWYKLDENAVPAEYVLQPRTGIFTNPDIWSVMEELLHARLESAARAAGISGKAFEKYAQSATHQEIVAGLGESEADRRHVFAFVRSIPDEDCDPELIQLKRFLTSQLPDCNLLPYRTDGLQQLCSGVEKKLSAVIEDEAKSFESRPALALEIESHDDFARERSLVFGREDVLDAIGKYMRGDARRQLVLRGASGSGKSAVMARVSEQYAGPGVRVRRFIGASPESSAGLTLLRSLCEEIGDAYGIVGETPLEFTSVARVFRERLAAGTPERPLVLFLDALDQLRPDDPARSLSWLAGPLPPNCRVVVSTTGDAPGEVMPLVPLSATGAGKALNHWLTAAGRSLQTGQRCRLLEAFERCGLPLYLRLAFEEARGWTSDEPPEACPLGEGVEGVIDTLVARLSLDSNHGRALVRASLGFLAAARYGLTEDEMLAVLSADQEVWQDFEGRAHHTPPRRQLPVIVWSRLFLDIEPYLTERAASGGTVVTFFHRQLAERASVEQAVRHRSLARYFAAQPHYFDREQSRPNSRKAAELPYQYRESGQLDNAVATLTDLMFVAAKCAAAQVPDLQADYTATIARLPEAQQQLQEEARSQAEAERWARVMIECAQQRRLPKSEEILVSVEPWSEERIAAQVERIRRNPTPLDSVRIFESFVRGQSHILMQYGARPGFVVQQAYNSADSGLVADRAAECRCVAAQLLMLRRPGYNPLPASDRVLQGHDDSVYGVSVTPDGRRAVSASQDRTLRLWDVDTGMCLLTLEGHEGSVRSASVTPDGRRAVSASDDRTLRLWDLETGKCLRILRRHSGAVNCVSVTPDGHWAVSASDDRTLRVWDLEKGKCLRTLKLHGDAVNSVSVTPDGRRAVSASSDETLRVWDLEAGGCLHILSARVRLVGPDAGTNKVHSVSVTPDGRRAISGSGEGTLRIWDIETGEQLGGLWQSQMKIESVCVTPDGRHAISAGEDLTMWVFDLETRACLRTLTGHSDCIHSVSVTPDGRRAISASQDKTLRVWDLETGISSPIELSHLPARFSHGRAVRRICMMPGGRRAVSATGHSLELWDLGTGEPLKYIPVPMPDYNFVTSVCVTPDGRTALVGRDSGGFWEFDLTTGQGRHCSSSAVGWGHPTSVTGTPDGRFAVSACETNLTVRDLTTGRVLHTLKGHDKPVNSVSVTPDGRRAVSSDDRTLRVWDLNGGECLREMQRHDLSFSGGVSVTPDGRRAVAENGKALSVWDLEAGSCLYTLEGHESPVNSVCVTPDGRQAVSASGDMTLRVWDLETGSCLHILKGHIEEVNLVTATPDGQRVVSAGGDMTLRVWDLKTGDCLALALGEAHWGSVVAFAPRRLVAGNTVGSVSLFDLRGESEVDGAAEGANRGKAPQSESLDSGEQEFIDSTGARPVLPMAQMDHSTNTVREFMPPKPSLDCVDPPDMATPEKSNPRAVSGTPPAGSSLAAADARLAAPLQLDYDAAKIRWEALPWWRRLRAKRPKRPTGT